jgi:hypothetical protein
MEGRAAASTVSPKTVWQARDGRHGHQVGARQAYAVKQSVNSKSV